MRRKHRNFIDIMTSAPLREMAQRISMLLLVTLGLAFLVLSKTNPAFVSSVRMTVTGALMPMAQVMASPVEAVSELVATGREWVALHSEVDRLRAENAELRRSNYALREMEAENVALRKLMNMVPGGQARYVTARLVTDNTGPFMNAALITGGSNDGVHKNQAVITTQGLIGRVIESGATSARVLLITDVNSRIPVMGESSREKAILTGNNSPYPVLSYLSNDVRLKKGEVVMTSGDGGLFPPDVPVGVVHSVDHGVVRIDPLADLNRLEYVTVVDYAL